jgi:hypothetical protein
MKTIHSNVAEKNLKYKKKRRAEIDILRSRLKLLDGKDKHLMTVYLENGCSIFQISQLTGQCESSVARRIKRLKRRILEGRYIACLRNRQKFSKEQMQIAKDYFLSGLSIKEITFKRNHSCYHVRETIMKIRSILSECENAETK